VKQGAEVDNIHFQPMFDLSTPLSDNPNLNDSYEKVSLLWSLIPVFLTFCYPRYMFENIKGFKLRLTIVRPVLRVA
jgi:hypothetical protein